MRCGRRTRRSPGRCIAPPATPALGRGLTSGRRAYLAGLFLAGEQIRDARPADSNPSHATARRCQPPGARTSAARLRPRQVMRQRRAGGHDMVVSRRAAFRHRPRGRRPEFRGARGRRCFSPCERVRCTCRSRSSRSFTAEGGGEQGALRDIAGCGTASSAPTIAWHRFPARRRRTAPGPRQRWPRSCAAPTAGPRSIPGWRGSRDLGDLGWRRGCGGI